jgi:hypothetical protein
MGVARWPDPAFNKEDDPANHEYGRRFHATVMQAASHIAQGDIASFRQLWDFVADARHQWAVASKDPRHHEFKSAPRKLNSVTAIEVCYAYVADRLEQQAASGRRKLEVEQDWTASRLDPNRPQFLSHRVFTMKGSLNGREVDLTSVALPSNASDFESEVGVPAYFYHRHEHIDEIMSQMDSMFARLTRAARSPDKLLKALGEMHWWLAHAMPDGRGSAAKAEMAVRALAAAQGQELPSFKRGTVPDLEAFLMDRKDFRASYPAMFDGPTSLSDGPSRLQEAPCATGAHGG